jgi:F-type H+-transporting ATPase subunit a
MSPTANLNVNAGLAITVMLITATVRLRQHGIVGFVKYYCGPPYWLAPLFIVIRVMEEIIRPLSLTMRLFGNIMSKEIILSILVYMLTLLFFADNLYSKILMLVPFLLRPLVILLGVVVSLVQALVFTGLSMVYVGEAVNGH